MKKLLERELNQKYWLYFKIIEIKNFKMLIKNLKNIMYFIFFKKISKLIEYEKICLFLKGY